MAKNTKYWIYSPKAIADTKLSKFEKDKIQDYFNPMIEGFKKKYIPKKPDRRFNYIVDIYSKWHQSYFYLCEKFKSEHPDRMVDEFEVKFVRLGYKGKNKFDLFYFRHTGQWQLVLSDITLDECREMILSNPLFQPAG
jgi:hypothetical protein